MGQLNDELEKTYDDDKRKRIEKEIEIKEQRYNDLQCGVFDPGASHGNIRDGE